MAVNKSHLTDSPGPNMHPRAGSSVSNTSVSSNGSEDNLVVFRGGRRSVRSHRLPSTSSRRSRDFLIDFQGSQSTPKLQDFFRGLFTMNL